MQRGRVAIIAGVCAVVVATVGTSAWLLTPHAPSGPDCSLPPPVNHLHGEWYTLASCPSTVTIASHSFRSYSVVRWSDAETVTGEFTANASVGTYLLNGSEMNQLQQQGHPTAPPPSYLWTCANTTVCNVTAAIPPSPTQCYVVIENLNPTVASVSWTKTFSIYCDNH